MTRPWHLGARRPWLRNTVLAVVLGVPLLTMLLGWALSSLMAGALEKPVALGAATLTLRDVEHGFFSNRLHYTLAWPLGNGEHASISLEQRLDPGPWPLQALQDGDWRPALLASNLYSTGATLGPQDAPRPLPLRLQLNLRASPTGALSAQWQAHAPELPFGPVSVQAEQVRIDLQYAWWNHGVQTQLQAQRIGLRQGGEESLRLQDVQHRLSGMLGKRSQLQSQATAQHVALWGQSLGRLTHSLDMHDVDTAALSQAMGGDTAAWPQALPPGAQLDGVLLSVEHPQAATVARVQADTATSPSLTMEMTLPRSVVLDTLQAAPRLTQLHADAAPLAQQQAEMVFEVISGQLVASGWIQAQDDGLRSTLHWQAEHVVVNGERLSWQDYLQRFFPPLQ